MKKVKNKVVIIGGGFAGISLAKNLSRIAPKKFDITLIDKNDYHFFTPMLYSAAVSQSGPAQNFSALKIDFKDIFPVKGREGKITILKNEFKEIVFDDNKVVLRGKEKESVDYDYLVFAAGSEPDFRNISGVAEFALSLKGFNDAVGINQRIEEVFKNAPKRKDINIVILGAGFVGCEFAGILKKYLDNLAVLYGHPKELVHLKLVESGDKILLSSSQWVRKNIEKYLNDIGVGIILNSKIRSVAEKEILLEDNKVIVYDVLISAMGVKPVGFPGAGSEDGINLCPTPTLRLGRQKNVFIIGDASCAKEAVLSGIAAVSIPSAISQAKYVSYAIVRLSKVFAPLFFWFDWRNRESLPPYKTDKTAFIFLLGTRSALVDLGFIRLKGGLAYFLKKIAILNYFTEILPWKKAWEVFKKVNSV